MRSRLLIAFLLLLPLTANAEPSTDWRTALQADHPLAGKVWDARARAFVEPDALAKSLARARFVLIGEIHDNADHHRLQGWLVSRLATAGRPALVMEMIDASQADALAAYLGRAEADAAGLGPAIGWADTGWPDWALYRPVAEAALAAGLAIRAGNPDRQTTRRVGREGIDAIAPEERGRLQLDAPLPPGLQRALLEQLYLSHCELMPQDALAPMVNVQRHRDAVQADAMLAADGKAVLIAGNGHVRADRGVPWYLSRRAPDAEIATVMLVEIPDSGAVLADLVVAGPDGAPAADFFWFTPAAEREDPCEELRERFGAKD